MGDGGVRDQLVVHNRIMSELTSRSNDAGAEHRELHSQPDSSTIDPIRPTVLTDINM